MQRFHTSSEIVCMNGADAKYAWILGLYRNLTKLIYKITKIVCVLWLAPRSIFAWEYVNTVVMSRCFAVCRVGTCSFTGGLGIKINGRSLPNQLTSNWVLISLWTFVECWTKKLERGQIGKRICILHGPLLWEAFHRQVPVWIRETLIKNPCTRT